MSLKFTIRLIFPCFLLGLLTACNSSGDAADDLEFDGGREINSTQDPSDATADGTDNSPEGGGDDSAGSEGDIAQDSQEENEAPVIAASGPSSITDLVLITGQSNALGSQTAYNESLDQPVNGFYAYTDQGWKQASLQQVWDLGWHPAKGLGDDPHNNFGFHFGREVVLNSNRVVGIVLVTAPGEGINHWDPDNYFFNKIRTQALAALNELPHKVTFDGILWHQGETDWADSHSLDPELSQSVLDYNYYSNKLWQLIDNFRNESWFDHGKPFICGETARSPVNVRLMALNRSSDSWTACVEGEGLPTWDEAEVHFSAEGLRIIGANYAEKYLSMTSASSG